MMSSNPGMGGSGGGFDISKLLMGAGLGSMGGGLGGLFGNLFGGDPSKDAMRTLNRIPNMLQQYYNPYIQGFSNPNDLMKKIGGGYQESPGFKFGLNQALRAGNQSAAAGGMAGSPMNQQQNMEVATQLQNQDYNNYLNQALGLYGQGANMSGNLGQLIAQALATKAGSQYNAGVNRNQQMGGSMGSIFGGAASLLPFLL